MARALPEAVELARRLIGHETDGSSDPAAFTAAADTVCRAMGDYLKDLVGPRGVVALMARALSLAKREHPLLASVTLGTGPSTRFSGLAEALASVSAEDAAAASSSILAHLLGLLILLLGNELGLQPVRKLWPQVASSFTEVEE
jgi:hypothetical protein